jgi:hypothetical protein
MLTIREVAEKTGHSPHKIRRLIKAIADQPEHPDRSQIEPTPEDVQRLTAEDVQFTWRVTEELVRRELGETVAMPGSEKAGSSPGGGESPDLVSLLQRITDAKEKAEERLFEQLRVKDEQLKAKDDQIGALNERLRESNFLMQAMQKQLPEPAKKPVATVEATTPPSAKTKGKPSSAVPKTKRKSWFGSMFS